MLSFVSDDRNYNSIKEDYFSTTGGYQKFTINNNNLHTYHILVSFESKYIHQKIFFVPLY